MGISQIQSFIKSELPFSITASLLDSIIDNEILLNLGITPATYDAMNFEKSVDWYIADRSALVILNRKFLHSEIPARIKALIIYYKKRIREYEKDVQEKSKPIEWEKLESKGSFK